MTSKLILTVSILSLLPAQVSATIVKAEVWEKQTSSFLFFTFKKRIIVLFENSQKCANEMKQINDCASYLKTLNNPCFLTISDQSHNFTSNVAAKNVSRLDPNVFNDNNTEYLTKCLKQKNAHTLFILVDASMMEELPSLSEAIYTSTNKMNMLSSSLKDLGYTRTNTTGTFTKKAFQSQYTKESTTYAHLSSEAILEKVINHFAINMEDIFYPYREICPRLYPARYNKSHNFIN